MRSNAMHGMRTTVLALCTLTIGALPAMAQDNGAPPPPPAGQQGPMGHRDPRQMEEHKVEMLTKHLNLTPDQVMQVKAIDDGQRAQMMTLRQDTTIAPTDKRTKMMALRQDSQAKIRAVLTDDQKPKYDAMLAHEKERMEQRQGGQGMTPPAPPPVQ